jgi:hypothetical protein
VPASSLDTIIGRISSLVAAPPFAFERAKEVFGFDLQPAQHVDKTFCIVGELGEATPYLGLAQGEIDRVSLRLARKIKRDAAAAAALLYTDCSSLQAGIVRDGVLGDYNGEVVHWEIPTPGKDDDFVVAELDLTVDFDREL